MAVVYSLSLLFVIGFIIVHFSSRYMRLSATNPRSPVLSFVAGMTIAYVFLYLLPELNRYLPVIKRNVDSGWLIGLEEYTYVLTLFGLVIYYGMDILTRKKQKDKNSKKNHSRVGIFILHMSAFFLYNLVIGYLLVQGEFQNNWGRALYFFALAGHFIGTDHTLKELHRKDYEKYGRWFLVSAILIGWLTGVLFNIHEAIVGVSLSVLAGGIIFNIFKDELPEGNHSNYKFFAGGVTVIVFLFMLVK